jgi:hypothetical protein
MEKFRFIHAYMDKTNQAPAVANPSAGDSEATDTPMQSPGTDSGQSITE